MESTFGSPFSLALQSYIDGNTDAKLTIKSSISVDEQLPVSYYFRTFTEMPLVEKTALGMCSGTIADIGAGVGCHAKILQERSQSVLAIEENAVACRILESQKIPFECQHFPSDRLDQYDTLLLLMNGIGLAGTFGNLPAFLTSLRNHLKPGGQILADSTNLIQASGHGNLDPQSAVIEAHYSMSFESTTGQAFPWLYIDEITLSAVALDVGLHSEVVHQTTDGHYLIRMTALT